MLSKRLAILLCLGGIPLTACHDRAGHLAPQLDQQSAAVAPAPPVASRPRRAYPLHRGITATVFWAGEPPSHGNPTNVASAWDDDWMTHFGGFDDPNPRHRDRGTFSPSAFTPRENPFYVALPYDDYRGGRRRPDAARVIPWANDRTWGRLESMCKNRWVKVVANGRAAYAQWEDVGPFVSDDAAYVFGGAEARPRNTRNQAAGLDVSPAVRDFLGLSGMDRVDWQFVEDAEVPERPWKRVITTSQVRWR